MKRTGRLFELMILLNQKTKFTVQELADQFSVSRRTMLRDLQLLSEMGVPLQSSPGLHGGYTVMRAQQLPPVSLSPGEAIGLMMSYEALEAYPESPFSENHLSALTKLRSVLPPEVIKEVDELRERVTIDFPKRTYTAPFLQDILQASKDQVHVEIDYESYSRRSSRIIYPYGLIAFQGFWYCSCYCYTRKERVRLRADRILNLQRREDYVGNAPAYSLQDILSLKGQEKQLMLLLQANLTAKGCKMAEWHPHIGPLLQTLPDGTGLIETTISASDINIYLHCFLGLGLEVEVRSPVELIRYIREEVNGMLARYES